MHISKELILIQEWIVSIFCLLCSSIYIDNICIRHAFKVTIYKTYTSFDPRIEPHIQNYATKPQNQIIITQSILSSLTKRQLNRANFVMNYYHRPQLCKYSNLERKHRCRITKQVHVCARFATETRTSCIIDGGRKLLAFIDQTNSC